MTTTEIFKLLRENKFQETEQLEFKRELPKNAGDVCKSFAAFANGDGGLFLIGVDDKDGDVVGVTNVDDTLQRLTSAVRDSIRPSIHPEIGSVDIGGGSFVVWAKVSAYPSLHICNEKIYIRFGPTTRAVIDEQAILRIMKRRFPQGTIEQSAIPSPRPPSAASRDMKQHGVLIPTPDNVLATDHADEKFSQPRMQDNPALPNNLPQQATSFIGREKEATGVKAMLTKTRLLTLTGSGGSGKTRLSLQVAANLLDGSGDGVWLVELAPLSDPALVPQAIADGLGVREEAGKPLSSTLTEWLKPKRLLLILDNAEHVVTACATLCADLLRNCPGVHLLVTSREPLNVAGEQVYRVPTLSLPDPKRLYTAASLSQFEAARLFVERAQAVQPEFMVNDANAPAVANLCWRLDGIPLAIELAAARVRSLSVDEVNARLGDRFHLLTGGSRTALPHQQTLRALIDWSYDLLTEQEKTVLCHLSVFAGGWSLSAAEAVCEGESFKAFEVLNVLSSLADKSLVVAETAAESTRYRLLETMRQYGAERLAEGKEEIATHGRHARWFLGLAEQIEPLLRGPEQAVSLARLESEHDNLRAALTWFTQQAEEQVEAVEGGLRLAGALWRFWNIRGHLSEGRLWLGKALKLRTSSEALVAAASELAARAKVLNGAGDLALKQGEYASAHDLLEESLTLRRQLGDQQGVATSLLNLGALAYYKGEYATARRLYEESLALKRHLGDQQGIANSLHNLGDLALKQGEYASAHDLLEESLTLQRQLGDQQGIAYSLNNLGDLALKQGKYASARILLEESLTLQRQLGDQQGIAYSLNNLGQLSLKQGEYASAHDLLEESLTLQRQLGDQQGVAESLEGMTGVAQGQDQLRRSVRLLGAVDALREALGAPLSPVEREIKDKYLSTARAALEDSAFTAAWEAGRAMTMEQAVEYALTEQGDD